MASRLEENSVARSHIQDAGPTKQKPCIEFQRFAGKLYGWVVS